MTLVTTVGSASTESYVTVTEAETYLEAYYPDSWSTWEELEDSEKEFRLKVSALLLNTLPLRGAKACRDQRLEFPRWWRTDEGYPLTEDDYIDYSDIADAGYTAPTVPQETKDAQVEVAWHAIHNGIMSLTSMAYPERDIQAFSLGGSLSVEFVDKLQTSSLYEKARLSTLDTAYFQLFKWIRRVSGGVV